jgi:hypothetical protein
MKAVRATSASRGDELFSMDHARRNFSHLLPFLEQDDVDGLTIHRESGSVTYSLVET